MVVVTFTRFFGQLKASEFVCPFKYAHHACPVEHHEIAVAPYWPVGRAGLPAARDGGRVANRYQRVYHGTALVG